ncbi:MAG TPA: glycosyltransferase [Ferrovibrio sp.]|uniref:CgeB family protein n=1 Tax=Ferrovibrio sp. TaxID=1917215 RepID=UPI002ED63A6B
MSPSLSIVVLGLSLSSSWGNGHATTYRALLRGLARLGHRIHFLERDVPWYAQNRDLLDPGFCRLDFYSGLADLKKRFGRIISSADAVLVGSYVPDGREVIDLVLDRATGIVGFYDIDTPVTATHLAEDRSDYISVRQVPQFDLYLSFSGGPILQHIERRFRARRAEALYCAVDEAFYRPRQDAGKQWDLGYLGTYSPDRQPKLEQLLIETARHLPNRRFVVAGPQYPDDIVWPMNVDRIEHLAPADHPAFYSSLRFTLNATRSDMVAAGWSPSVRLFEAAACGTPIISDPWDGLTDILPEHRAIVVARSTDDVISALAHSSDARRLQMAATAREIVLSNHTGSARAQQLERFLFSLSDVGTARAGLAQAGEVIVSD